LGGALVEAVMTDGFQVAWVGGGGPMAEALDLLGQVQPTGGPTEPTVHALVLGDPRTAGPLPPTTARGELWLIRDFLPDFGFPQFLMEFVASRGVDVLHIHNSRLAADLLPAMLAAFPDLRIVASVRLLGPEETACAAHLCQRYANLVHAFVASTSEAVPFLRRHGIPDAAIHRYTSTESSQLLSTLASSYRAVIGFDTRVATSSDSSDDPGRATDKRR